MKHADEHEDSTFTRRTLFKAAAGLTLSTAVATPLSAAQKFDQKMIQVWSCGGLAEAFMPANKRYQELTGIDVAYTGAFAAALGKSLLANATTDVFAGRVLGLAQKLREAGKMEYFKPLCYTSYVLVTPKGNPAGIHDIQDLARPGTKVVLAPDASPPGGSAVSGLLKKAGILEQTMKNTVIKGSCVQRTMEALVNGEGDVSVVERRITRLPSFQGKVEIIEIDPQFYPPPPLTFTIGVMRFAKDKQLAEHYLNFIRSEEGQSYFGAAGFIPAISATGQLLTEKLGVKDV